MKIPRTSVGLPPERLHTDAPVLYVQEAQHADVVASETSPDYDTQCDINRLDFPNNAQASPITNLLAVEYESEWKFRLEPRRFYVQNTFMGVLHL